MLINKEFSHEIIHSPLYYMWLTFKMNNLAFSAMCSAIILTCCVLFADFIIPHVSSPSDIKHLLLPPYWVDGGMSFNLLGTDQWGRDTLSCLLKGLQLTLGGALIITLAISVIGLVVGASGALMKGLKASILHHFLDAFLAIPTLLSALIIIVIFGPSYEHSLMAVLLSLLPQFIRGIYLSIENELNKQYIISLRLDGATSLRLLRYGILPNMIEPLVTLINRIFTLAVLEITTLGFLGFGSQSYTPELGALIANGIKYTFTAPWLVIFPGFAIFAIILIFNMFAEGLRHAVIEVEDE